MSKRMQRDLIDRSGRLARRHTPLSLAIATALALPGLANAQDAPAAAGDAELEEIVVTVFRQALISSIEVKREAMSVVRRHYGRVPLKWWVAQPYAVWYRSLLGR